MNVHYCVSGRVESEDSALLDDIEAELPSGDEVRLADEFTKERAELDNDDGEYLTARMTFQTGTQGKAAAEYLFERVQNHPLADTVDYSLRLYRTPEGAVTVSDVREWYESNEDKMPADSEGETYVPDRWNPNHHIKMEDQK